ncbi:sucrose phosphorylase [Pseudozobellia thermophila]|uniref:Sucrose phosphorylase n=1 Tax=Pseudozobellia thermophila TaxID=192903 RepID=A0A1M6KJK3_9FLAO|nr:sucrose phosphorylase [Pseudozobellia thermophila]SHJ59154.1 sucrose phosphorylase [Pseudozobellia thermophila]
MQNKVQLITYVDRLGCDNISELNALLQTELKGLFGGVHILPFFTPIDGQDAGFDPIDHTRIDPRIGDWDDLRQVSGHTDIMADMIVNHISAESVQFQDYLQRGKASEFYDLILTEDKVFPHGPTQEELAKIYRPRPGLPFTRFTLSDGTEKNVWTTFTPNQIDIDVRSEQGKKYLDAILRVFQGAGVSMVRLDAVGYAIKKAGTSCFMIDETFDFIASIGEKARRMGISVLVEIHSHYKTQIEIAKRVDYVYDFALPVLVLDTLFNRNASNLKKWLHVAPRNVITVLDTHDGIGIVDVASEGGKAGLIEDGALGRIVDKIHGNSKGTSRRATGGSASNLDLYQVNCTYFEALGRSEKSYLMARAIQFFVPGVPQVYYVGLFGVGNDMELLEKTNVGRDINRHYFTKREISERVDSEFFDRFRKLMLLRNDHPAFDGVFEMMETPSYTLHLKWSNSGDWAELFIDLEAMEMRIRFSRKGKAAELKLW